MAALELRVRRRSDEPVEQLAARLSAVTTAHPEGFTLVSRLSGAGVVVRSLRAPPGAGPWFGRVDAAGFRVAEVPDPAAISPFQAIVHGVWAAAGSGATVELALRPHPDAHTHARLFQVFALILGLGSLVLAAQQPALAGAALLFAGAAVVVPTWRARRGFAASAARAIEGLDRRMGWAPA